MGMNSRALRPETLAVHGGQSPDPTTGAVAVPITQSVSFAFESAEHAAALFNLETPGYRYSRIANPTVATLERRLALLEGGAEAIAVASGQAALHYALLNLASPGAEIVAAPNLYGTSHTLLKHVLPPLGLRTVFAAGERPDDIARCLGPHTRAVFCESVGNPAGNICDIAAIADLAHGHGVPLIVDNTVATPMLLRPIDHGADIVVHSLTKYLGGHGTTLGGAIVDSGRFDWSADPGRFPMFNEPDLSYHGLVYSEHFGMTAYAARCRSVFLRTTGAVLAPLSAFLLLQGLETVAVRIDRHVENGARVARFLHQHPLVRWIGYAGFPDSPYHVLARRYLGGRAPALLSFGHSGGYMAAARFYDSLELVMRVVNLGDVRSLACHPASTTHRQMTEAEQRAAGVSPETIRLSIGIEHADDIIADLDQALWKSHAVTAAREKANCP